MSADVNAVAAFLYREARLLDDRQFESWLELHASDVEYWMPAWDDDDELTQDPHSQISLIYYPNRDGLEDRVFRIKTERSSASMPEPRTNHMIANVEVLEERNVSAALIQDLQHRRILLSRRNPAGTFD